jgi:hypothetical protein
MTTLVNQSVFFFLSLVPLYLITSFAYRYESYYVTNLLICSKTLFIDVFFSYKLLSLQKSIIIKFLFSQHEHIIYLNAVYIFK